MAFLAFFGPESAKITKNRAKNERKYMLQKAILPPPEPPILNLEGWLPTVLSYMRNNGLPLATADEIAKISRVQRVCNQWARQFAEFDRRVEEEAAAWQRGLCGGPIPLLRRTPEQIKHERDTLERAAACTWDSCRQVRDVLATQIWPRVYKAGRLLAAELDEREQAFYRELGFGEVALRAGNALRKLLELRAGKPVFFHWPPPSPDGMCADFGIVLDVSEPETTAST